MNIAGSVASVGKNKGIIINVVIGVAVIYIIYKIFNVLSGLFSNGSIGSGEQNGIVFFPDYTKQMTKAVAKYAKLKKKKVSDIDITDVAFMTWLSTQIGKSAAQLAADAKTIYDAKGLIHDEEDSVFNVLKTYKTKTGVAALVYIFSQSTRDLAGFLQTFMSNDQFSVILKLVSKLPDFLA